ncbi:MAG: hypothetical protein H6740_28040 [Alphaproteobacteria bacterium]|nr:hypothetical protein [Alphaproteobacteria bacterium]
MSEPRDDGAPDVVWFTIDRSRFFLIPEGAPLRDGSLRLRSLKGVGRGVDASVAGEFEISKEQATELLGAQIEGVYGGAREALLKLAAWAGQEGVAAFTVPERLEDFIGLPTGAIITEPDRVKQRVQEAMGRAAAREDAAEAWGAAEAFEDAVEESVEDDFTDELLGEGAPSEPESEAPETEAPESEAPETEAPEDEEPPFREAEEIFQEAVREASGKLRAVLRSPEVASALESVGDRLRRLAKELREESAAERARDNVVEFPGARKPTGDEPEA